MESLFNTLFNNFNDYHLLNMIKMYKTFVSRHEANS